MERQRQTNRERERERERGREGGREREGERERGRKRERETERQRGGKKETDRQTEREIRKMIVTCGHMIDIFAYLYLDMTTIAGFSYAGPRGFLLLQERERSGERKPLVAGDANLTIMLQ